MMAFAQFIASLVNTAGCVDNAPSYSACRPDEVEDGTTRLRAFVNYHGFLVIGVASGCLWATTWAAPDSELVLIDHRHRRYGVATVPAAPNRWG
jgi:hypothetical protein